MIYKFNEEDYELIRKYVMEVYEGDKSGIKMNDKLRTVEVSRESYEDFVDAADYAIIHFGMVNQDYLTDLGYKLQFLYDAIYGQTKYGSEAYKG